MSFSEGVGPSKIREQNLLITQERMGGRANLHCEYNDLVSLSSPSFTSLPTPPTSRV